MRTRSLLKKIAVVVAAVLAFAAVLPFAATGCGVGVTGVSLDKTLLTLSVGDTEKLTAAITPEDAENKNVTWSSSDEAVATIAPDGTVTAVKAGRATVTVTTEDGGFTATCEVAVKKPVAVTGITLNKTDLTLRGGEKEKLTAIVTPAAASNKNVTWKSDKTSVATVGEDGTVTAVAPGRATITVTSEDGNKKATCSVLVVTPVAGVSLSKSTLAMARGDTHTLVATVTPTDATYKSVTWKSSDETIAAVNDTGVVTAGAPGTATITVKTTDGEKSATCEITVTAPTVEDGDATVTAALTDDQVMVNNGINSLVTLDASCAGTVYYTLKSGEMTKQELVDDSETQAVSVEAGVNYVKMLVPDDQKLSARFLLVEPATDGGSQKAGNITTLSWTADKFLVPNTSNGQIDTWAKLKTALTKNADITLACNIDAENESFASTTLNYNQVFKGQGFAIHGLNIRATRHKFGLFQSITGGTVKNVRFYSPTIEAGSYNNGGLIAGTTKGSHDVTVANKIENVTVEGLTINGTGSEYGLLMGNIFGNKTSLTVTNSRVSGTIKGMAGTVNDNGGGSGILGLAAYGSTLTILGSDVSVTFEGCKGSDYGGAIGSLSVESFVLASASSFTVNVMKSSGGISSIGGVAGGIRRFTYSSSSKTTSQVYVDDCYVRVNADAASTAVSSVGGIVGANAKLTNNVCRIEVGDSYVKMSLGGVKRTASGPILGTITDDNVTVENTIAVAAAGEISATDNKIYGGGTPANAGANIKAPNFTVAETEADIDGDLAARLADATANPNGHAFWTYAAAGNTLTFAGGAESEIVRATGVTLDQSAVSLAVGATATLAATVAPDNAMIVAVVWSSSKEGVATVKDGKITAVAAGTATITVKTLDGNKTATCTVTVTAS